METSLASVPVEVLHLITLLAGRESWKALRLVDRTLAILVTPLLFRDLEVWIQTQSLLRLVSIARSDRLSQHVQSLSFTNDYITTEISHPEAFITTLCRRVLHQPPSTSPPDVHSASRVWMHPDTAQKVTVDVFDRAEVPQGLKDLGWTSQRLFTAWRTQMEFAVEQCELLTTGSYTAHLSEALKDLRNLSSVRFPNTSVGGPRKMAVNNGARDVFISGPETERGGHNLSAFLHAASAPKSSSSSTTLTSLTTEKAFWRGQQSYPGHAPFRRPDFGTRNYAALTAALPFLAGLATLELDLEFDDERSNLPPEGSNQAHSRIRGRKPFLDTLLASLPSLARLTLRKARTRTDPPDLRKPLLDMKTCCLRALTLKTCLLGQDEMALFFERHGGALRTVRLENVTLLGGRFVDFFTSIRGSAGSMLDRFVVRGYLVESAEGKAAYAAHGKGAKGTREDERRRRLAREGIEDFVMGRREHFPSGLLDLDSAAGGLMDWETAGLGEGVPTVVLGV